VSQPRPDDGAATARLQGLLIDWGGVLTASMESAMRRWAEADGVDHAHFRDVMRGWVGAAAEIPPDAQESPTHRLERGELHPNEFERMLAAELAGRGSTVDAQGLLTRMLGGLSALEDDMIGLVRRVRKAGIRTALLSNSWGEHYPEALWDGLFDEVVISGRVGMRKPDRRIFEHTAALLDLVPQACVMVDDLVPNIRAAVEAGMVGVLHRSYDETVVELEALFEIVLR
jgi:epoxide hydrolase-like predicted phosphatase